jgi:hypothetical protein
MLTRRSLLGALPFACATAAAWSRLTKEGDRFLEDLSHRSFLFFWEQANAGTGLVRDRALAYNAAPDRRAIASSAATGFGLTGLCIAAERGWIPRAQASRRVLATLRFYGEKSVHEHGWFYHFVDSATGARVWNCELSTIDTALLLAGVVPRARSLALLKTCSTYFAQTGFRNLPIGGASPQRVGRCHHVDIPTALPLALTRWARSTWVRRGHGGRLTCLLRVA